MPSVVPLVSPSDGAVRPASPASGNVSLVASGYDIVTLLARCDVAVPSLALRVGPALTVVLINVVDPLSVPAL